MVSRIAAASRLAADTPAVTLGTCCGAADEAFRRTGTSANPEGYLDRLIPVRAASATLSLPITLGEWVPSSPVVFSSPDADSCPLDCVRSETAVFIPVNAGSESGKWETTETTLSKYAGIVSDGCALCSAYSSL